MLSIMRTSIAAAIVVAAGVASGPAFAADETNAATFADIADHFGAVPQFFHLFPEAKLASLWEEYKNVQLNPDTALDAKTKQLIGLAVAAQAKCSPCIYLQTSAAFASGASFKEVQEAVAIFVVGDHWSEYLTDDTFQTVKTDTNALVARGAFTAASN